MTNNMVVIVPNIAPIIAMMAINANKSNHTTCAVADTVCNNTQSTIAISAFIMILVVGVIVAIVTWPRD